MKNILDKIFNIVLNERSFSFAKTDTETDVEETNAYSALYERLSQETQKEFLHYIALRGKRETEEVQAAYKQGFKDAISLIMETLMKD